MEKGGRGIKFKDNVDSIFKGDFRRFKREIIFFILGNLMNIV